MTKEFCSALQEQGDPKVQTTKQLAGAAKTQPAEADWSKDFATRVAW
jgi:hypothetical protein